MFFTVGITQKQLKEINASIYRERHDIPQFRYIESDCPGAQAPEFDNHNWNDFPSAGCGPVMIRLPGSCVSMSASNIAATP